jgi:hypothetical protein
MSLLIRRLWKQSPELTACTIVMLAAFVLSAIGIFADPRIITGVPAWLKPTKFAISTAIFCATMAWIFESITIWPRFKRFASRTLAAVLFLEVAIIDIQAARGTTSHFNQSTPLDTALFGAMGIMIGILWVISAGVAWALFRQKFENAAWGWSLRLGTAIMVIGAGTGGMMVAPTHQQMQAYEAHQPVPVSGAHTVGAPDGGPGIPGAGWSLDHGDLRIPHFFGLHAFQALPFIGWLAVRRRRGAPFVFAAAGSYLAFVAILTWQALRGQSIVEPDEATLIALGLWAALTVVALIWSGKSKEEHESRAAVLSV